MSPCDLKILIVNLFQEDGGNLKCLSCGTIFCRTGLDILVCNPGDPLFHGQFWCSFSSWYSCIMYLKGIWIPHLESTRLYWGPSCNRGEWEQTAGFLACLLPRVVSLFLYGVRVGVRPWPGRRDDLGGLRTPPVVLRAACILGAPLLLPTICFSNNLPHWWRLQKETLPLDTEQLSWPISCAILLYHIIPRKKYFRNCQPLIYIVNGLLPNWF